ncbi:ABC transporter ATP-binding protein [Paenibacillus sp. MSJ-34]|uniref:ABC transporter ATP-binding protein n=1 Tax=Paenibacillus sp. MSJ-34 TaxID=2841529 RepID=UPI001C112328|nr:ABC transporter ATP-binding protein [Paenibacillus sp. MSJ-34]MBU5444775.1 ABC transporter ATP-binding protein/permease [Paenibacillus sp. MSJ-34]
MNNGWGHPHAMHKIGGNAPKVSLKEVPLRRILGMFRPYMGLLFFIVALALAGAVIGLLPPLVMKEMIDTAIPDKDIKMLVWLAVLLVALPVASGMLGVWQNYLNTKVAQGVMRDLRQGLFGNLQRQSIGFFTASRSGEVIQRVTDDVQAIQGVITNVVVSSIMQTVVLATSIGILFALDWRLALISVVVLPLSMLPVRKVATLRKKMRSETQKMRAQMSAQLGEVFGVSGAMLTRIFGREQSQEREFGALNKQVMDMELKLSLMGRWFLMFVGLLGPLGTAMIYLYGGYSVIQGTMTIGAIVAFAGYLGRLYQPFGTLLNLHVEVMTALGVFQRIFEYLDLKPDVIEREDAVSLPQAAGNISYEGVSYSYDGETEVLHGISFEAKPGEVVALVGPSGAGKTTLIGMIARLYDPTAGAVKLDGRDLRGIRIDSLRSQVAYVTQESFLFHATIRENLAFAKENATMEEMESACRKAFIHDFIVGLPQGYDTVVGERGHRLSGGERQRLSIARAILKDPVILLLDEATSHLDSESEAYVQAALQQLMKGRTTLVIAHRLSTILAADQILVIHDGRIAERGTHSELLERDGLYATLYDTQFQEASRDDARSQGDERRNPHPV